VPGDEAYRGREPPQQEKGLEMNTAFKVRHANKNVLMYACSETDANILYATNFFCPDPFIFVRTAEGKRHLVMSDLEIDRAKRQSNADKVHSLAAYTALAEKKFKKTPGVGEILTTILRDFGMRHVAVPSSFPLGIAEALRANRIHVTALPDPFFPERIYKKPAEIDSMRKTMQVTEKGMKAAVDILKASKIRNGYLFYEGKKLTVEALRNAINTTILSLGCVPTGTIVAPGKQGCDPHERGSGIIRANETVIIDIFPRSESTGYFADITRTFVRGKASDEIRKIYRAVYDGQRLGLDLIRDGAKTRAVHGAIQKLFEKHGYRTGVIDGRMGGFFHGTGHGLGLEIHEPPRIAINKLTLQKGMAVTVEPGLYYLSVGGGVRIEDTVIVTQHGVENITRFPKFLEI
jgi:Xaa-Pro aminopeptidase